jgi:hypothetical protein
VVGHRWLLPLILDRRREQKFVDQRWFDVDVQQDPPLMGTLPAALEGSLDVFVPAMQSQGKTDPIKDRLGISGTRVVVPEKASILWDFQPSLAQHYKATKCRNGVGVEMNQGTSQIIRDAG